MVPAGSGGGDPPPYQADHRLSSPVARRRPRCLGALYEALGPGNRLGGLRLDRGPGRPLDLLAWGCPPRSLAEAAGPRRRPVGKARVPSPVDSPGVPPHWKVTRGVLPPDLGGDPRPVAGPPFQARSALLLRQLCALWRVHEAAGTGRTNRCNRARRRSRGAAPVGLRPAVLPETTMALGRA